MEHVLSLCLARSSKHRMKQTPLSASSRAVNCILYSKPKTLKIPKSYIFHCHTRLVQTTRLIISLWAVIFSLILKKRGIWVWFIVVYKCRGGVLLLISRLICRKDSKQCFCRRPAASVFVYFSLDWYDIFWYHLWLVCSDKRIRVTTMCTESPL